MAYKRSLLLMALVAAGSPAAQYNAHCDNPAAAITLTGVSCDADLNPPQVSCLIPADVQGALQQNNGNSVQRAANLFSWQQFIALNWPADVRRGEPAAEQPITAPGPRVWETWKEAYEALPAHGVKPQPWRHRQDIPQACRGQTDKVLMRTAKVSDVLDATLQALPADATLEAELKDQRGRLIRYEIRLNQTVFHYLRSNRLYHGREQAKAQAVNYPAGSQIVKAAWREIDSDDDAYFLTTDACVCNASVGGEPSACDVKPMGLAGFHIMTKTASAPQWIWSTFEQIDNTLAVHPAVTPLNDAACPPERCPPNRQTERGIPTQLSRVSSIPNTDPNCADPKTSIDNLAQLNHDVQQSPLLANAPLRYYELVGTQWPLRGDSTQPKTVFDVRPQQLANTTMESFSQTTSSCMGCHAMARTLNPDAFVSADFSFILNNAQPQPRGTHCVNVEASESCSNRIVGPLPQQPRYPWERQHWPAIQLGYAAATRTYEVLGRKNVGNRLHCESCHLNAGGNPDAAWWVDIEHRYPREHNGQIQTLADRINGCFERSMNGYPLCATDPNSPLQACDDNPVMTGLITYMQWLGREYHAAHPRQGPTPISGFPDIAPKQGDAANGQAIYDQKCAFCHNNDGQGRYASHSYFRPALWGPESYNACAGMAGVDKLAAFVRANMPYTSGGLLTDQEAYDLAAFIDNQCRPGKGGLGPNGEACSVAPGCVDGKQVPLP